MSYEQEMIEDLIEAGRLELKGEAVLDGLLIYKPEADANKPEKNGFYPPSTPHNGSQNEKVNELRNQWLNSDDRYKQKAAEATPHLFVVFSEHFNPAFGSEEWMNMWRNVTKWWNFSGGDNRIFPYVDENKKPVDGHLFVNLRNATYLEDKDHDKYMADIVNYYRFMLEQNYSDAKYGPVNPRP